MIFHVGSLPLDFTSEWDQEELKKVYEELLVPLRYEEGDPLKMALQYGSLVEGGPMDTMGRYCKP